MTRIGGKWYGANGPPAVQTLLVLTVPCFVESPHELHILLEVAYMSYSCWSSAMYWIDIVQLALHEAGGQCGPAAEAAAKRLIREKDSLFMAR